MPKIKMLTKKQETFCQNVFKGMTQRDSWINAGYSATYTPAIIDIHACQLAAQDKIRVRIQELRQKAEDATVATVLERKQILTGILRANVTDYQSENGIEVSKDSPNTRAIESIETRTEYSPEPRGNIQVKRASVPEALRNKIHERDGKKCKECGSETDLQIDHILPLSLGGKTEESNLQTLCRDCNSRKRRYAKAQPHTITKLKLLSKIQAAEVLNKMDRIYSDIPANNNLTVNYNIVVASPDGEALLQRVLKGEGTVRKELNGG